MENQQSLFKGRDKREKNWFWLDNEYLNGYAKHFGPVGTAIYLSLCRHADNESQQCFPAQKKIAEELGVDKRTVIRHIQILKNCGLVEISREKDTRQKWTNNVYTLLDKKYWKKPKPGDIKSLGEPGDNNDKSQVTQSHTNKTQDTNKTHKNTRFSFLEKKKKPYYNGEMITVKQDGTKWIVRGSEWFEFAGKEKEIVWK
jgi:DNA-binding MarR family transcriptional regulator